MQVRPIDEMTTYEVRDLETGELLTSFSGATHNWTDAEEVAVAIGGYVETVSPYGREV